MVKYIMVVLTAKKEVCIMLEIWNKDKISRLTLKEKTQWFNCLNYKLEEDRDISLSDPFIKDKQLEIKNDYFKYLESCATADNFHKYYIEKQKGKIISVLRINIYDNKYILEGLQTNKDYLRKGFAGKLIDGMIHDLKKDGINILYSEARIWNDPSVNLQEKMGFQRYGKNQLNYQLKLDVEMYIKKQLFNNWASDYNDCVITSEKNGTYPFAGYSEIKYKIIELISKQRESSVLDMGVGTGEITTPLYNLGYSITGIDLSEKMINIAKKKMPNALFIHGEFNDILTQIESKYDFVIFNYSIHHLSYSNQIELLENLYRCLNENGIILIGDVSAITEAEMHKLKTKNITIWDDEELYPILEKYNTSNLEKLYDISYIQHNEVAGLYQLQKRVD